MRPLPRDAREPADLERRLHAFVVDRVLAWTVVAAAYLVLRHVVGPDRPIVGVAVVAALVVAVGAVLAVPLGRTGSTPGLAAVGLRLVDVRTGAPLGVTRAMRRQLLLGLATVPTCGLGVAVLAWTAATDPGGRRRGWHDRVTGSEVVAVPASHHPAEPEEDVPEEAGPRHVVNLTALRLAPVVPAASHAAPTRRARREPPRVRAADGP
ncbi:RDD family protein, partial [Nocardioides sp.]|uniref:RDD family protein n=1 Tax=Nocardioides sp. TaxID=35761 RepID=UPI0025E7B34F